MTEEMKTEKNEGRGRKIVAGTLVGLGVLGLGMAAATQLNLGWSGNFQAGTVEVESDCQTSAISVTFSDPALNAEGAQDNPWSIDNVQFSGIDGACVGLNYEVAYKSTDSDGWTTLATGTADTTITAALPEGDWQDLSDFALTIYGE